MTKRERFEREVDGLRDLVGCRHQNLCRVAMFGLGAGMTPQEVVEYMTAADLGDPPMPPKEIADAVNNSAKFVVGGANVTEAKYRAAIKRQAKMCEAASPDERGFVRRMIRTGAAYCRSMHFCDQVTPRRNGIGAALLSLSGNFPYRRNPADSSMYHEQARSFVRAFFSDVDGDDGYMMLLPAEGAARSADRLFTKDKLIAKINASGRPNWDKPWPTHLGVNLYNGKPHKSGNGMSYGLKQSICTYHHFLIEFDYLPVDLQSLFWTGVIASESLDVLTVVYSRGKSLHGIISAKDDNVGGDLFGASKPHDETSRARAWAKLARLVCSDYSMTYRTDASGASASQMSRFPGGYYFNRHNQRQTYLEHLLLYAKKIKE